MSATYETYSERGSNVAEKLLATAKRNPEGALLVAAGVCLMMRGVGSKNGFWRSSSRSLYKGSTGYPASTAGGNGHHEEYRESKGMMDEARDRASEFGGKMRQSAEEMAGYADHMRRAAADKTGRIVDRTTSSVRNGVGHMVEEQPLALALLGLAAGAAVAALLPTTRVEERTLGPIGERITEGAEEAGRRLKDSATEAGKRLATEGLSEAARDVTRSFTESDRDQKGQSESSGSKPASGSQSASSGSQSASSGAMSSSSGGAAPSTSSGSMPGSTSTASPTPGRAYENGLGKSETEPGSSVGTSSSGTGRAS